MGDQHRPKLDKIAVCRIFHFHYAPGILTASDLLSVYLDHGIGANDGEGDRLAKLLNLRLVILILVAKICRFINNKVINCSVERFSYKKIIDIQLSYQTIFLITIKMIYYSILYKKIKKLNIAEILIILNIKEDDVSKDFYNISSKNKSKFWFDYLIP